MSKRDLKIFFTMAFIGCLFIGVSSYINYNFIENRSPVYAYLDPSIGAMILSALIGIFATILLGAKTIWYKITSLFGRSKKDNNQ